jgi:hypothetical protein
MTAPTRYALALREPDEAMNTAGGRHIAIEYGNHRRAVASDVYAFMLAASPNGGCVTARQRASIAAKIDEKWGFDTVPGLADNVIDLVLAELGLQVDAPAGEVADGR